MRYVLVAILSLLSIQIHALDAELEIDSNCASVEECEMKIVEGVAQVMTQKFQNNWRKKYASKGLPVELKVVLFRNSDIDTIDWINISEDREYNRSIIEALDAVFPMAEIELLSDELFEKYFKENVFSFGG